MENQKIKYNNYIAVMGWMVSDLKLSGNELLVYAIIYGFCQDGEGCFSGSCSYLCSWLNCSRQTVLNVLKKLVGSGLVQKVERISNGVKFCSYKTLHPVKNFDTPCKKFLHNNIEDNINKEKEVYKEKESPYLDSFNEFWSIYPKQRAGSKEKAYASFCKAVKDGRATPEKIIQATKCYARSDEVKRGFAKGCAAWLNDDRFNNNYSQKEREDWDEGYGRC